MTTLTSQSGTIEFGRGCPTLLINDQLRVIDQDDSILEDLKSGRIERLLNIASNGKQSGIQAVDILLDHPDLDEVELLPKIAGSVHEQVGCFISLDSRNPAALEAALKVLYPYKALINSVNAEQNLMDMILPIAADFGAAVVGIPIGTSHGVPLTVEERIEGAYAILKTSTSYGIQKEDLVIDAICLAGAAEPDTMRITLQTLSVLETELGVSTILGIGNAGYGMPTPTYIDLAYLLAAVPWGLNAALVNPNTPGLVEATLAIDFLIDRDPYGKRYIKNHRQKMKNQQSNFG